MHFNPPAGLLIKAFQLIAVLQIATACVQADDVRGEVRFDDRSICAPAARVSKVALADNLQLWLVCALAGSCVLGAVKEVTNCSDVHPGLEGFPECLESLSDPAAVTRLEGNILLSNGQLTKLFPNLLDEESRPRTVLAAMEMLAEDAQIPELQAQVNAAMQECRDQPTPVELVVSCSRRVSLKITICPQVRASSTTLLLWIVRNVGTEQILAQRDKHSQKMQTITRFAGGMAHEFNNILTAILGNLELMRARPDRSIETITSNIESAEVAALRASQLILELRRFASREIPAREVRSVARVVRRTVRILSGTASSDTKVTFNFDNEQDLYSLINADQLQEALLKLSANAQEALGPNGGLIHFEVSSTPASGAQSSSIQIDVIDTGHGMTEGIREQAFEPLFTTKDNAKASGLGMSIAHGLIEEMGGELRISDSSEQGTVVSVLLPRVDVPGNVNDESSLCEPKVALRIATVEHERSIQNVLHGMLALFGHNVSQFADGAELLAALRGGAEFELVIIDHVMPGMTGRATYQAIRQFNTDVAVIICSGKELDIKRFCPECIRQPDGFLRKPFSLEELQSALAPVETGVRSQDSSA